MNETSSLRNVKLETFSFQDYLFKMNTCTISIDTKYSYPYEMFSCSSVDRLVNKFANFLETLNFVHRSNYSNTGRLNSNSSCFHNRSYTFDIRENFIQNKRFIAEHL